MSRITDTSLIKPGMLNGLRVGVLDEFNISEMDPRNQKVQRQFIEMLKDRGAVIKRVSVPFMRYVLPFYFTLRLPPTFPGSMASSTEPSLISEKVRISESTSSA